MTLGDQLHELRHVILRDNSDLIAGPADQLWSDETLLRYIKDAEMIFARRTLILRDSTTLQATRVTLAEGVQDYRLHRAVMSVLSARYAGGDTPYDLQRSGRGLLMPASPSGFAEFDPTNPFVVATNAGAPLAFYTDETAVHASNAVTTLSVYPLPSAAEAGQTLSLRVIRVPICGYTLNDLERESEIPETYQLDVLEWAAYRAQRHHDGDAGAPTKSEAHKVAFDAAVDRAIRELKRQMFGHMPIRYGANGFRWEH